MSKKEMNLDELDQVNGGFGVIGSPSGAGSKYTKGDEITGLLNGEEVTIVVTGIIDTGSYRVSVKPTKNPMMGFTQIMTEQQLDSVRIQNNIPGPRIKLR